jgi:CBS domain containing-hemolysin-like protein
MTAQAESSAGGLASGQPADPKPPESWLERLRLRLGFRAQASIRDDIEDAIDGNNTSDEFTPQERALLKNVLGFREIRIKDVMIPRADIIAVPAEISIGELLGVFRTAGHSRLPVYGETLDDPKGMVHIRDFVDHIASRAETGKSSRRRKQVAQVPEVLSVELGVQLASAKILRPVLYAPPSMPAIDLLVRMQATRTHMALVIDEYGGTDGLVSIEDLVEVIVGDIEDEHDHQEGSMIQQSADGTWLADARLELDEAEQALGVGLRDVEASEDIETIGGFIVSRAGRVPVRGELILGPEGLEFEVTDADPRRVKRVKIHKRVKALPGAPPPAATPPQPEAGPDQPQKPAVPPAP